MDDIESCAMIDIRRALRGKWATVILWLLQDGTLHFGQIKRLLPSVTDANLTKDLRLLEEHGLVHREVYREVPPKVKYSLTDLGGEFAPVLEALEFGAAKS